ITKAILMLYSSICYYFGHTQTLMNDRAYIPQLPLHLNFALISEGHANYQTDREWASTSGILPNVIPLGFLSNLIEAHKTASAVACHKNGQAISKTHNHLQMTINEAPEFNSITADKPILPQVKNLAR
ncbi:hypothetical protein ACJX0J_006594, partial [Zea mays]